MVGPREGDHELAGRLVERRDRHTVVFQDVRVADGDQLMQQVWLRFEQFGRHASHRLLEQFGLLAGYAVPVLALSPVQKVDAIAPVVLVVPTERAEAHADVEPGHDHAADVGVDVLEDAALQDGQIVQIPRMVDVLEIGGQQLGIFSGRKAGAEVVRVQIGAVLDGHRVLHGRDQTPELLLDQLERHRLARHVEVVGLEFVGDLAELGDRVRAWRLDETEIGDVRLRLILDQVGDTARTVPHVLWYLGQRRYETPDVKAVFAVRAGDQLKLVAGVSALNTLL